MADMEKAVRDAAKKLRDAINEAKASGYTVAWPKAADGLSGIAISATAKVKTEPMKKAGK